MMLVMYLFGRNVFKIFEKAQKSLDETNSIMRENILGMRVVKSFGIQDEQVKRFRKASSSYKKHKIRAQIMIMPIMSVVTMCLQLGIVSALFATGFLARQGNKEVIESVFSFTTLLMMVLSSVVMAIVVVTQFITSKASIKRLLQVINTNSDIVEPKEPKELKDNFDIKFSHVNFRYSKNAKKDIIRSINFEIKQGEFLGVIGGTGSGKSTLVNLIPRLYDVDGGSVTIGGINVKDISLNDLRKNISVVLQENNLFQGNLRENLKYGDQNATDKEIIEACKNSCA
ncbi:MAG: ABC transporter ATP-binding protein/permease [Mycoplasmoidaceae bacterium]|nr:ABC transporter ATP-binding protein/permease [Mycoplasmoidaceae bacterium]